MRCLTLIAATFFLSVAHNSNAYDPRSPISVEELKHMEPLPTSAMVQGTVTNLDKGFGSNLSFLITLDKSLNCELNFRGTDNVEIIKRGDSLIIGTGLGGKNKYVYKTFLIGDRCTVTGVLTKKKNGSFILKGVVAE